MRNAVQPAGLSGDVWLRARRNTYARLMRMGVDKRKTAGLLGLAVEPFDRTGEEPESMTIVSSANAATIPTDLSV